MTPFEWAVHQMWEYNLYADGTGDLPKSQATELLKTALTGGLLREIMRVSREHEIRIGDDGDDCHVCWIHKDADAILAALTR